MPYFTFAVKITVLDLLGKSKEKQVKDELEDQDKLV